MMGFLSFVLSIMSGNNLEVSNLPTTLERKEYFWLLSRRYLRCFIREEQSTNLVTIGLLPDIICMLECKPFSQINGFCTECMCGDIHFQWVCVELNLECEYLLVVTHCFSTESKYVHSCRSGQHWTVGCLQKVCAFTTVYKRKNWLNMYIILQDEDCEWTSTVCNSVMDKCHHYVFSKYVNQSNKKINSLIQTCYPCVFRLYVNPSNDKGNWLIQICCPSVVRVYVNPSNENGNLLIQISGLCVYRMYVNPSNDNDSWLI